MNIFVGSLPYNIQGSDLERIFGEYGEVTSARVISDRMTRRSKGFGFVEMSNDDEAQKAIDELNGSEVSGRTIVVNVAKERDDSERGDRSRYNRSRRY